MHVCHWVLRRLSPLPPVEVLAFSPVRQGLVDTCSGVPGRMKQSNACMSWTRVAHHQLQVFFTMLRRLSTHLSSRLQQTVPSASKWQINDNSEALETNTIELFMFRTAALRTAETVTCEASTGESGSTTRHLIETCNTRLTA